MSRSLSPARGQFLQATIMPLPRGKLQLSPRRVQSNRQSLGVSRESHIQAWARKDLSGRSEGLGRRAYTHRLTEGCWKWDGTVKTTGIQPHKLSWAFSVTVQEASFSWWWKMKTKWNYECLFISCAMIARMFCSQPAARDDGHRPALAQLSATGMRGTYALSSAPLCLVKSPHGETPTPYPWPHSASPSVTLPWTEPCSCSAHVSPYHLWGWSLYVKIRDTASKTVVLRKAGIIISQVQVKITDNKLYGKAGLRKAKERSWW